MNGGHRDQGRVSQVRSIRERLNSMQPEPPARPAAVQSGSDIERTLPGKERITVRGAHFVIETQVEDPTESGMPTVGNVLPTIMGSRSTSHFPIDPSEILFLDTETTGLDRSVGTHVFLVGLGFFSDGQFTVEQHFLRGLHEEPSMLESILERVNQSRLLVTYNGRGFDWQLIENRLILHGYRDFVQPLHWDLLTASRRIWRNRLQDCSLGNIERQVLGVQRFGDIPGALIPDLYFAYLRNQDPAPLRPVFSHNQEDVVSLARLADQIISVHESPHLALNDPIDRLSFGLACLKHGDINDALALLMPLLDSPSIPDALRFRASKAAAEQLKRRARFSEAIAIWDRMTQSLRLDPETSLYPLIELAKLFEHKEKDYHRALRYVERAWNLVELNGWCEERKAIAHRFARLLRRHQRASFNRYSQPGG